MAQDVEMMVPLKYAFEVNFLKTLEIPLIDCEVSFQLKWSKDCHLVAGAAANQVLEIKITDTKFYVLIVTLWTQDNIKLVNN